MTERILLTGHSGFLGPWVIDEVRRQFPSAAIWGASRSAALADHRVAYPDHWIELDLANPVRIEAAVAESRPDAVVHLACAKTGTLEQLLDVNALGCERLLAALEAAVPNARIVVVGSSSEIGRATEDDVPLDEEIACRPVDNYGITKLAQSAIAGSRALRGQQIVRLRAFNLLGPGMPESLLAGRCAALVRAAANANGPVELRFGPLDTHRDYVDVRDMARAVAMALGRCTPGALYNIGSGQSTSGHVLVQAIIEESGVKNLSYSAAESARTALVPWQTADIRRAQNDLGWRPVIPWRRSIRDLWEWMGAPQRRARMAGVA